MYTRAFNLTAFPRGGKKSRLDTVTNIQGKTLKFSNPQCKATYFQLNSFLVEDQNYFTPGEK